jgi:hypothetical protein
MTSDALRGSRALWNRTGFDLASDEALAQLLDRGEMAAWRELYALCRGDAVLRSRVHRVVLAVPMPLPRFWLAALASLGETVDLAAPLPPYPAEAEL